ncbi:efflux RND transporter periplasmic adaptor subunit [Colwellia asteriadis]|uniref:Efflux RND transporter periplasmic adaptor subunit n=1 Tax=Colwellia asteriadis TaxID=517723 RepID=A0ABN1L2S6_9GAMM
MNILRWIIVAVVLAAVVFGLYSYKSSLQAATAAQGASMPEPAAVVTAVTVDTITYQDRVQVNGEVQAFRTLTLNNELAGQITKLNAPSGSRVKKGQILLELDHRDEDAKLLAAQATLTLNQQTLNRYIRLQKNKEISEDLVDQAQANVQIAKSTIAVLKTAIAKKELTAPFDATVGIHNLEVGQYLENNSQVLQLVGVNEFTWIDFYLPQFYQELTLGSTVQIHLINPTNDSNVFEAEIIAIDPQLSHASRNLKYRAQLPSATLSLKPNTLVTVKAPTTASALVNSVPDLAIKRDPLGTYVFVLELEENGESYRAQQVKVEVGARQGDQVMITSGLKQGQLIASKGSFKLFPGMKTYVAASEEALIIADK